LAWIAGLLALALAAPTTAAEQPAPAALTYADQVRAQAEVELREVPSVDFAVVTLEDIEREAAGLAPRFAIPNEVAITPDTDGLWEMVGPDLALWRLRISSPGALSINLGFTRYRMPEGGRLMLYSADRSYLLRPFTADDNEDHGELWTPVVLGDEIVVEVTVPVEVRSELELELTSINAGYRGFGEEPANKSGSCNVDVVCPEGNGWWDEIPSVGVISTGGSLFCTGFMVNNTAQDETPYFMTAYHCGIRSTNASSLVVYWNYRTSECGGTPDGSLSDSQTGSYFRAQYSPSDVTLVELDSDPDPAWGITFAGWDRTGNNATTAVAIHHPSCDEKRISFEYDSTTTTSYLGTSVPGDGTHERVIDWDVGTTEGGSSGSPLFNQDHRVIGQLHGGYAACGNDSSDWYGKFSVSWTGGGTSSTRLRDWLDPGNTGVNYLNTLVPGGCQNNADCDDGLFCNGAETCDGGSCTAGTDPCPGEDCDEANDVCLPLVCNDNGTCESGEDCNNCPGDCISGDGGAVCGNDICETGAGEDCRSCPADCNGVTTGRPSGRYCCGDDIGCGDSRCTGGGNTCSTTGGGDPYCCGDGTCEGDENGTNCSIDCGAPPYCGDGVCNSSSGEDTCSCPDDCGTPPSSEVGLCTNGADDDCDGPVDCADGDCTGDPACDCALAGEYCDTNADCCSGSCHPAKNYCR
jgi:V8-like Glu-specific endopeptidase